MYRPFSMIGGEMTDGAMASRVPAGARWKLRISAILWFLLVGGFLLALPVLLDIGWLVVAAAAILALILGLAVAALLRLAFRGQRQQSWGVSYFKTVVGSLFVVSIILATPLYFAALLTSLRPLTVPLATLSNGSKTVVFQGMMHVGSEPFYKGVIYDLEKALTEDYVIYYEGVRGDPAGDKWFSDTLAGGGDLSANYQMLSDVCGLQFQLDYFQLLTADMAARPDRHVNADVTTADMMHEYERLVAADPAFAAKVAPAATEEASTTEDADNLSGIVEWLTSGTPEQKKIAGYACRGSMTWALGRNPEPSPLDPVILDFRNAALADRIDADAHQSIYITYGAGHLPGLLRDLKTHDPTWEIKSIKWQRVITVPEELEGHLPS
jgi:hypothetical protein